MPTDSVFQARANATLREQFIQRGLATGWDLDQLGYVSHSQLDLWAEAGVLEEAVLGLQESWGLGLLKGAEFNLRIRRGYHGRFGGVIGSPTEDHKIKGRASSAVPRAPHATIGRAYLKSPHRMSVSTPTVRHDAPGPSPIRILHGERGTVKGKDFRVYATPKPDRSIRVEGAPANITARALHAETTPHAKIHEAGDRRIARLEDEARRRAAKAERRGNPEKAAKLRAEADRLASARGNPEELRAHGERELFEKRGEKLEGRISKRLAKAQTKGRLKAGEPVPQTAPRSEHELTAAEVHFNDAGRVSQRTLLAYATEASSKPTTAEMYRDAQGNYHPSRAALHAHIIDMLLRERNPDGSLSATNPYLRAPDGKPRVIFAGGGYAAGKGGLLKHLRATGQYPDGALVLDPDVIKAELPEFQASATNDPEANLRTYQEAWDVAQQAMKLAQKKKLNVVVDGITNTSAKEVAARVKSFTDAGYDTPHIHYVSVPTDVAAKRAIDRARKGAVPSDRRMIPDTILRAVHRDVSATIPEVMKRSGDMGAVVHVWDNNRGKDPVTGENQGPKEVARALDNGQIEHYDSGAFQQILNKASEPLPGLSEPTPSTPSVPITVSPRVANAIGESLSSTLPTDVPNKKLPQPTSNIDDLLRISDQQALPAYRELLDLGLGVSTDLGAMVHDISAGKDWGDVQRDVSTNMDKPHVIIAPTKSKKRVVEKLTGDNADHDASQLYDTTRGTILVPRAADLPGAIETLTRHLEAKGWTIERIKNKLNDGGGDRRQAGTGYGDVQIFMRSPATGGRVVCELQVNTTPMWWAKEVGPGHKLYEAERTIREGIQAAGRPPSPEEEQLMQTVADASGPLYDRAWGLALGQGVSGGDVAMTVQGNEDFAAILQRVTDEAQRLAGAA